MLDSTATDAGDRVLQHAWKAISAVSSAVNRIDESIAGASDAVRQTAQWVWSQVGDIASDRTDRGRSAATSANR